MTHAKMIYDNNIIIGFMMEGHAGFNPGGPDILCASLSAASQMTINGVLDWIGLDADDCIKKEDKKAGVLVFEIPLYLTSITTNQLFKSFEMFIDQLSEQYSNFVVLERREGNDNKDN